MDQLPQLSIAQLSEIQVFNACRCSGHIPYSPRFRGARVYLTNSSRVNRRNT